MQGFIGTGHIVENVVFIVRMVSWPAMEPTAGVFMGVSLVTMGVVVTGSAALTVLEEGGVMNLDTVCMDVSRDGTVCSVTEGVPRSAHNAKYL